MLCGCEGELDFDFPKGLESDNSLSLSVRTASMDTKVDNIITGSYLPDGSLVGVYVRDTNGEYYDGINYSDYVFKASGTGSAQTWRADSTIKLSATEGYCYAYYPRTATTSKLITRNHSVDFLYSGPVSVNDKNKNVNLTLRHVFSNIRFALKRGTYGGIGKVTKVAVKSSGLCYMGQLNLLTSVLTGLLENAKLSTEVDFTLTNSVQYANKIVVPKGVSGTIFLYVTIDGQEYSVEVPEILIQQGYMYTYTLTVNAGQLALSGVTVGDWGYNSAGSPTITAAGYSVQLEGDYSDIAFSNSVNGNTVTIKAISTTGYPVKAVTMSGTATLSQSVSGMVRTITLSDVSSNVTVMFNGYTTPPPAIAENWNGLADGVYAVTPDKKPANASDGNELCGLALVYNGKAIEITTSDVSNGIYWGEKSLSSTQASYFSGHFISVTADAIADMDGQANTERILKAGVTIATLIEDFRESRGSTKWYLPSLGQMKTIYTRKSSINALLAKINGSSLFWNSWSSTVYDNSTAWGINFSNGDTYGFSFTSALNVIMVRDL